MPAGNKKGTGRPKGAISKTTRITREWIADFLSTSEERKRFESDWKDMEARDRVNARLKLIEFIVPKMAAVVPEQENGDKRYTVNWQ